jgi:hypothetical protein
VHFHLRHIKLLLSTLLTKGALGHPLKFVSIVLIYIVFILMLMVFTGLIRKVDSHLTNGNKELDFVIARKMRSHLIQLFKMATRMMIMVITTLKFCQNVLENSLKW